MEIKIVNYFIATHDVKYLNQVLNDYEFEYLDATQELEELLTLIEQSVLPEEKKFRLKELVKCSI